MIEAIPGALFGGILFAALIAHWSQTWRGALTAGAIVGAVFSLLFGLVNVAEYAGTSAAVPPFPYLPLAIVLGTASTTAKVAACFGIKLAWRRFRQAPAVIE